MAIIAYRINEIPDLTLMKYQSIADSGVDGLLKRQSNFLRQWHGIGNYTGTSFHLLYCFNPSGNQGQRLEIYFFVQSEREDALEKVTQLVQNSPISEFYAFRESPLPDYTFLSGATLKKNERTAKIYDPLSNIDRDVYFVPHWEMNQSARLFDLFKTLEVMGNSVDTGAACAYRIDLYPTIDVQETIRLFSPVIKSLQGDNRIQLVSNTAGAKEDWYVQTLKREYEDWLSGVQTSPHFRVNIYAFSSDTLSSKLILNAAASEAVSEGDYMVSPIKADENGAFCVRSRCSDKARDYCNSDDEKVLKSWPTTYLLSEAEPFFRFPVLYDGESIEIPKETDPLNEAGGLVIGVDNNSHSVTFPVDLLPRHGFFTGAPGSGKTNTMLYIVRQLIEKKIPFLVMEPAKKEYREILSNSNIKGVNLFSPHLQSLFPLRVNPFEFPKGVMLSQHINAIIEVFQGTFELSGAVYKFLSASIERAYKKYGWEITDVNCNEVNRDYPTLQDVYNILESEIEKSDYDGELKGNMKSWLQVRLGNLMERDTGELFNCKHSTFSPEQWLYKSSIVELEVLGEQAKNFFVLLICHYISETLRINPNEDKKEKPVRHVIFIEEAHNIIAPTTQQMSAEVIDPKIAATGYIVKMLAEVRALRESIIIADQLPTALAPEVAKNTGLKLVHRLVAMDDRQLIGSTVSASALQLERLASFSKGKALMFYEKTQKPFEVQVDWWKKENGKKDEMSFAGETINYADDKDLYMSCFESDDMLSRIFDLFEYDYGESIIKFVKEYEEYENNKLVIYDEAFIEFCCDMLDSYNKSSISMLKKIKQLKELFEIDAFLTSRGSFIREYISSYATELEKIREITDKKRKYLQKELESLRTGE